MAGGYRLQLTATYLTVRVRVGVASLILVLAIALFGSMASAWLVVAIVAVDLAVNVLEVRRPRQRAVVSLISRATMFGLAGIIIRMPLVATSSGDKVDIHAKCESGGKSGQAGALRLGIARALCEMDAENRPPLSKAGLLTRDSRMVERKKYGLAGARRRFQFSKR